MVDAKKPAKPTTPVTAVKPAAVPANISRHVIPALTPLLGETTAPATPAIETVASEKAVQPASAEPQASSAPAQPARAEEKIGPKLRRKDEILKALRAGSKVEKVDGLCRIVNQDGSKNATSKRRILSLESQKLLIASADGKTFTLDVEADRKAQESKPLAVAKPATEVTK